MSDGPIRPGFDELTQERIDIISGFRSQEATTKK